MAGGRGWDGSWRSGEGEWPVAEAVDVAAESLIHRLVDEVGAGDGGDWERPT